MAALVDEREHSRMEKEMASEQLSPQAYNGDEKHGMESDVETGLGEVDIQRIEKVYRYGSI